MQGSPRITVPETADMDAAYEEYKNGKIDSETMSSLITMYRDHVMKHVDADIAEHWPVGPEVQQPDIVLTLKDEFAKEDAKPAETQSSEQPAENAPSLIVPHSNANVPPSPPSQNPDNDPNATAGENDNTTNPVITSPPGTGPVANDGGHEITLS